MKAHVDTSLKERSTSLVVFGNTGIVVSGPIDSDTLFCLRIKRWRFGKFVRLSREDSEVRRLSSNMSSVIWGLGTCGVRRM